MSRVKGGCGWGRIGFEKSWRRRELLDGTGREKELQRHEAQIEAERVKRIEHAQHMHDAAYEA